jgi:hypothetical protein
MTISNDLPPSQAALAQYQDPIRQRLIGMVEGGSDFEYDRWQATIEYGRHPNFHTILDFFANLPTSSPPTTISFTSNFI